MTMKEKSLLMNDLCTRLQYKTDVDTSVKLTEIKSFKNSSYGIDSSCDIDEYLERQIQTYKHLQDTLSVLEGIVDVLDVVTKKVNND